MQLLSSAIPELQRLAKEEGDYGRQKINEYTKYITVFVVWFSIPGYSYLVGTSDFYLTDILLFLMGEYFCSSCGTWNGSQY